jgi:hypothetical protein
MKKSLFIILNAIPPERTQTNYSEITIKSLEIGETWSFQNSAQISLQVLCEPV